ncbi:MAG: UDP-N-acetylmuramoyl-L-alanyl-D-glutamate--2,6-diaminopimelate ligase [Acidobacteria bacterium]|nr:UDP-N-acetylmuramoyl-L-alanyl-D-glutamate--2,6-diaminopimelate ligase [Acidobacteriota bacterium]
MNLAELLERAEPLAPAPAVPQVLGLDYDSRRIEPGFVFFAFPGERVDGHDFIPQALRAGAVAVVSERPAPAGDPTPWVQVRHGRRALAEAALAFYDRPDRAVRLLGVTGTNGKTTTVYLIDSILRAAGHVTARLGTIGHTVGDQVVEAVNTTPESLDLVRLFARTREIGGSFATLEVSSHGLELGRIYGFEFLAGVFTNLSQDHLDFHGTMEAYARAKRRLFEGAGARPPRYGVINADDAVGRELLKLDGFERLSYAIERPAAIRSRRIDSSFEGLRMEVDTPAGVLQIRSHLLGAFNVQNILAAIGGGIAAGVEPRTIEEGVAALEAVPGRFETVREGQPFVVAVDYAHTPDALDNVLRTAREIVGRKGRILTVFGCGGDRDRTKRPLMGESAGRGSDRVILTSDNPRTEDPLRILADASIGLDRVDANYVREADRRTAIERALREACPGDLVMIAGKGHETVQKVAGRTLPFDDREVAREMLQELRGVRRS